LRRAHDSRTSVSDGWANLGLLVTLVNEAILGRGTQPAFVGGPAGPIGLRALTSLSVDVPAAARSAGSPRTSRHAPTATRAHGAGRPTPTGRPGERPAVVDADHAEIWRLVHRAQDGDGEAFGELYDRYVDVVYRFIYFRVNDRGLAEDFTSETFLRALRRISTISYQGRDIGAWFITIARNIVLDHLKSARHRLEVPTAQTMDDADEAPGPESAALNALDRGRLMSAVNQLGDEQRECVLLRFMQGFSVSETASVMGKNDGAIKALQHRAIRKLAELVGDELR
jgi:RNA polymerase sigma-70 factor (ECF subfamily)